MHTDIENVRVDHLRVNKGTGNARHAKNGLNYWIQQRHTEQ